MRRVGRTLVVLVALAALGVPVSSGAAPPRSGRAPKTTGGLEKLWRSYPLRPKSPGTTVQGQTTLTQVQTPTRNSSGSAGDNATAPGSRTWQWLVVGMALMLSATAVVAVSVSSHVRHGGGLMDRRKLISRDRSAENDEENRQEQAPSEHTGDAANRVATFLGSEASPPPERAGAGGADLDRVVGQVGSVLHAAEEAAIRMHEEALQEAERIIEHAQTEASTRAEAARRDADAAKAEADRVRSEAQLGATHTREAAEEYAAETRTQAEVEARNILSTAERQAIAFASEAESRHGDLVSEISLAEERLRQLVSGLHDLAARLDNLLSTPVGSRPPSADREAEVVGAASERQPEGIAT
jgi:hypothetical protein